MMVRLEFVEGNSSKFWEIELKGTETVVTYGKIGSSGQNSVKGVLFLNARFHNFVNGRIF